MERVLELNSGWLLGESGTHLPHARRRWPEVASAGGGQWQFSASAGRTSTFSGSSCTTETVSQSMKRKKTSRRQTAH